jgi:predicted enzyme involved in methoxymalonyl-ACP biosynthesis
LILSSKTDIHVVGIIITKIVGQIIGKFKTLYKAIVLDLDDTLWMGTLSEDGIDKNHRKHDF